MSVCGESSRERRKVQLRTGIISFATIISKRASGGNLRRNKGRFMTKLKSCKRCSATFDIPNRRYCDKCVGKIMKFLKAGKPLHEISKRLEVTYSTVEYYRIKMSRVKPKPPVHSYFDYRGQLEAMLAKLRDKTGIKDFNTQEGQNVLTEINRTLENRVQSVDDHYDTYSERYQ
jgi:hypothetical protein